MTPARKSALVLVLCTAAFLGLAAVFVADALRERPAAPPPSARQLATAPLTVRISAESLIREGGDTSTLDCYACHDKAREPQVPVNAAGQVILPADHFDIIFYTRNCLACHAPDQGIELQYDDEGATLIPPAHAGDRIMSHGSNSRNSSCFNCHNPSQLDQLVTRDGTALTLSQSTLLCASCHGPTYRDWEAGIHGRTIGFWKRELGTSTKDSCTSCHDPHSPSFPQLIPLPGPQHPHPRP